MSNLPFDSLSISCRGWDGFSAKTGSRLDTGLDIFKDAKYIAGFWAAAPKGTKSCRTQGDFRSSVCPSVRSSVR